MHPLEDNSITKLIIYTAARLEQFANAHVFKPIGLTITAVKIMGLLVCRKTLTPTDILNLVGGTKSNVTQRLNFLEKSGYISRSTPKHADKRKIFVKLTAKGRKKFNQAHERINEKSLILEKSFRPEEIQTHREILKKINILINESAKDYANDKNKCFCKIDL